MRTAHVICLNDFPEAVFEGSLADANKKMGELATEYVRRNRPDGGRALHWHLETVRVYT